MTTPSKLAIAVLFGASLLGACGGAAKPANQTTTHTETSTENSAGEVNKSEVTVTTTEAEDGTKTVKSTEATEHTVPPAAPAE